MTCVSRRQFLATGLAAASLTYVPARAGEPEAAALSAGSDVPLVDLHAHLDNSTVEKAVEVAKRQGVKLGIVEHAGTELNEYPVVLSNDEELRQYLAMLDGQPVYGGVQAEWTDWSKCFSREMLAKLDYTLMDAMTFAGKDGRRVKLWSRDVEQRVEMSDRQAFMDRYVDYYVELIERQPIDVLANVSWLPAGMGRAYETFWTPKRIRRVVSAAVKHRVAIEISSNLKGPKPYFLRIAKEAGVKFSFGSNGRYPNMGKLDYCLVMVRELGLTKADMFTPGVDGQKAVQRRKGDDGVRG